MSYNGIDISNYQYGINLNIVPCDFVLILVSQGSNVVNGDWERQYLQAKNAGKMVGLYHYIAGGNAATEAATFVNATKKYNGQFVHIVDWESGSNRAWGVTSYLAAMWDNVRNLCGHTVMIYGPQSAYPWEIAKLKNAPTWVAQYGDYVQTGYQTKPWNEGAYTCDIRQYSSVGQLSGWNGNLDLDKYYGTRDQWSAWAGNGDDDMALSQDDVNQIAAAVWGYNYKGTAEGGNMYNSLGAMGTRVRDLPGDVWGYSWKDGKTGMGAPAGGNMYNSLGVLQSKLDAQTATIAAMQTAVETLSKSLGANPATIAQTVHDAVVEKLNTINLTITTK